VFRAAIWLAVSGFAAARAAEPGATKILPLVDGQDIRSVRLSVGGEPFRKWVTAIAQDNYGFIWLGTDDGLFRYDGYNLKAYRHDPNNPGSLSSNTVKVMYKDHAGVLWIGTAYGGLERLDPAHNTFTHYQHDPNDSGSLIDQNVLTILQDHTGSLWVGTQSGLDRLDLGGRRFLHYRYPPEDLARSNAVTALYEDRQGNLLVGGGQGLYKLEKSSGQLLRIPKASVVSGGPDFVNSLQEGPSGVLWVTSVVGTWLTAVNAKTGEFSRYAFRVNEPGSLRLAGIHALHEDRNGTLWLGTFRDGLLKFDRERRASSGIPQSRVARFPSVSGRYSRMPKEICG